MDDSLYLEEPANDVGGFEEPEQLPMSDDELIAIIELNEKQAIGYYSGEIADEQATALDYYNRKPMGTEEEGRSSVTSSDVYDVVEGMTPAVAKPFVSSSDLVKFEAFGPEDEEAAEQETDYVNYIVTKKNNAFEVLVNWIKTGLLQKNGIVKYWWDVSLKAVPERYQGLSEDQLLLLIQEIDGNEDIQITGHSEYEAQTPYGPIVLHDIDLKVTKQHGEPKYAVVPPEEFLISRDAKTANPQHASFVQHRKRMTVSAIREMGIEVDEKDIDLSAFDSDMSQQSLARNKTEEIDYWGEETSDFSMRETSYRETYITVDYDGDGIAELRKVILVGGNIKINEEAEETPFCSWTPVLQPFKFYGKCPADESVEIQTVKTTLMRQTLDNIYTINNNRTVISNEVNIDDLLDNAIGGIVRMKQGAQGGPAGNVMAMPVTPIGGVTQPMIEYMDTVKENRTGFTRYNQGSADLGNQKTLGEVQIVTDNSNMRVDIIARSFAELGLKQLMLGIHGLCRRHATQEETVRLRNKWVTVDPRAWKTRFDMSVDVGLGTADAQRQLQGITNLIGAQAKLAAIPQLGLVGPQEVFNAHLKLAEQLGFKNGGQFFKAPSDQPQIPPEIQQQLQQLQQALQEAQGENARLKVGADLKNKELDITAAKNAGEHDIKQQEVDLKYRQQDLDAMQEELDRRDEMLSGVVNAFMTDEVEDGDTEDNG